MANNSKQKFPPIKNPLEQGGEADPLSKVAVNEVKNFTSGFVDSAMESIGLKRREPMRGEIELSSGIHKTNQTVETKGANFEKKVQFLQRVNQEQVAVHKKENAQSQKAIEALLNELRVEVKKLESQTAQLTGSVKNITVESSVKASLYHTNFFEWVLASLRDLRKKVGESRMWLNTWQSKKKKKGYWGNAKKGNKLNLEFMMNEERSIATANG